MDRRVSTHQTWTAMRRMAQARFMSTSTLLLTGKVLVVGGSNGLQSRASTEVYDSSSDSWSSAGTLHENRSDHSATLLPDGRVLVVGGLDAAANALSSAEVYDPVTNEWSPAGNMKTARAYQTATLLHNGKVLVVGGVRVKNWTREELNSVEEYDPVLKTWSEAPALREARTSHTATLLPDGKVLVLGAYSFPQTSLAARSLELYDPATRNWLFREMPRGVFWHTSTLLTDGKVLVAGGFSTDENGTSGSSRRVSLYAPATNEWFTASPMDQARDRYTATLLPDGKVIVTGGSVSTSGAEIGRALKSTEVYDPQSDQWSSSGDLVVNERAMHMATLLPTGKLLVMGGINNPSYVNGEGYTNSSVEAYSHGTYTRSESRIPASATRANYTSSLLPDGKLLIAGGDSNGGPLRDFSVYDPQADDWSHTGSMLQGHSGHTATALPNGRILVLGGGRDGDKDTAELYDPRVKEWSSVGELNPDRRKHTATLLPNGKVLVAGGVGFSQGNRTLASASLFDPTTRTWSSAGSMRLPRAGHSAILLLNGKVLVVGGESSVRSDAELYDPETDSWTSGGAMTAARSGQTATLLRNGKVLVIGGRDAFYSFFPVVEEYDPLTNNWSPLDLVMSHRAFHSATLLRNGSIFLVGGDGSRSEDPARNEVYDPITKQLSSVGTSNGCSNRSPSSSLPLLPNGRIFVQDCSFTLLKTASEAAPLRPVLAPTLPSSLAPGDTLTLTGTGFRGLAESTPLVSMSSPETGQWFPLAGHHFTHSSFTTKLPYIPVGQYLLNVTTHGVTSSQVVFVTNTSPPTTQLGDPRPRAVTQETTALFTYTSSDVDLKGFECSLDESPFSPCVSPMQYPPLRDGGHVFRVRGLDLAGNVASPTEYRWTIDATPPDLALEPAPPPNHNSPSSTASFSFTSKAGDVDLIECSLDGAEFTRCHSPQVYDALGEGRHQFQVRATDHAGNVMVTPGYDWTVDTVSPKAPSLREPAHGRTVSTSQIAVSGTAESRSVLHLFVDGALLITTVADDSGFWRIITPPVEWGPHTVTVTATDLAGNKSPPSTERAFTTKQGGYYGMGCGVSPGGLPVWSLGLLGVVLSLRRRRGPSRGPAGNCGRKRGERFPRRPCKTPAPVEPAETSCPLRWWPALVTELRGRPMRMSRARKALCPP